jgi:hypothetical protein
MVPGPEPSGTLPGPAYPAVVGMLPGSTWATSLGWFPTVPDGSGMVPGTMNGPGGGRGPRFFAKSTVLSAMKSGD